MSRRRAPILAVLAVAALAGAPAALADSTQSSNWSGYAVHRSGLRFNKVSASWRQPSATCVPGERTFSSFWVGLGGFRITSTALEQIGTEVDCTGSGRVVSSAWYELVPAGSRTIGLTVRPGDAVRATVAVYGHRVTLSLRDLTTGRAFHRTVHAAETDTSSAEWIVEAPSECTSDLTCQTLPLADFGSASFVRASARTTRDHRGTIADRHWRHTKIVLAPGGTRYIVAGGSGTAAAEAVPSALVADGSGFTVSYAETQAQRKSRRSAQRAVNDRQLVR